MADWFVDVLWGDHFTEVCADHHDQWQTEQPHSCDIDGRIYRKLFLSVKEADGLKACGHCTERAHDRFYCVHALRKTIEHRVAVISA